MRGLRRLRHAWQEMQRIMVKVLSCDARDSCDTDIINEMAS
jgi:hypothetical protein